MQGNGAKFIVEYLVEGASGRFTVIGRCGEEPIRVNDTFDSVFRYKPRRYPDGLGDDPVKDIERPASLRVEGIQAYERPLDELGQGMTGTLFLSGDGLRHIAPGWILGDSHAHDPDPPVESKSSQ